MATVLVSLIAVNGIQYSYSIISVVNTLIFYYEIYNKLGYVTTGRKPNKKDIINTAEVAGNVLFFGAKMSGKKKDPKITPKKIKSPDKCIMPVYQRIVDLINYMGVQRENKKQRRRDRVQKRVSEYKLKLEMDEDAKEESKMHEIGYTRCQKCSFYTEPSKLLEHVCESALKFATESKKYSADELVQLQMLIMNNNRKEPRVPEDFYKFREVFAFLEVKCKHCNRCHKADAVYSPESICDLQDKKNKMIYQNKDVVHYEHDVCA
jgi:hypothetical protein